MEHKNPALPFEQRIIRKERRGAMLEVREKLGVTTWEEVARATGISARRVYVLVGGGPPTPSEAEALESAAGL